MLLPLFFTCTRWRGALSGALSLRKARLPMSAGWRCCFLPLSGMPRQLMNVLIQRHVARLPAYFSLAVLNAGRHVHSASTTAGAGQMPLFIAGRHLSTSSAAGISAWRAVERSRPAAGYDYALRAAAHQFLQLPAFLHHFPGRPSVNVLAPVRVLRTSALPRRDDPVRSRASSSLQWSARVTGSMLPLPLPAGTVGTAAASAHTSTVLPDRVFRTAPVAGRSSDRLCRGR